MTAVPTMFRRPAALLVGVLVALAGTVHAQYASDPFFERTVVQSRGFGLELMDARLLVLATYGVAPEGLDETIEGLEEDMARFGGTLNASAPDLAHELEDGVEAIEAAFERGEDLTDLVETVRGTLEEASRSVLPADVRTEPAYVAAVAADLLLAEGGVAEGVEEAIEEDEPWMYPLGWATLQRVKALWGELASAASDDQASFADQYLATLEEIYPAATLPDVFPSNPEEAEAPAQSLVGIIESVADAALYPGRDAARLARHLETVAAPACEAFAAGEDALAFEHVVIVGDLYDAHLTDVLALVASAEDEAVVDSLAALGYGGEEDEEGDDDGDDVERAENPSETCQDLVRNLSSAGRVLGG
ncbi:MAG: hypothetical protein RI554_06975 [Trueperaceae bacterium]|nr:hypothetical protein [Trueperaceae bacterium]